MNKLKLVINGIAFGSWASVDDSRTPTSRRHGACAEADIVFAARGASTHCSVGTHARTFLLALALITTSILFVSAFGRACLDLIQAITKSRK